MKKVIMSMLAVGAAIVVIPAIPGCFRGKAVQKPVQEGSGLHITEFDLGDELSAAPYKVLDVSSGQVMDVPVRDYVIGAVCAEMPAAFEVEALKAQAAAAHTYAERQRIAARKSPDPKLCGADFSNDTSRYQSYFTDSQIRHYFGENYESCYSRISAACDEVLDCIITYEDEPIIAAFHSMSSGRTESAENAWGTAVDYLIPVDSSADMEAPKYREEVRIPAGFMKNRLETVFEVSDLGDDRVKWLVPAEISPSGTVVTALVGTKIVTGADVRSAFGLRSADFTLRFEGDEAIFTTKGFGHGVGMSQYGANDMAKNGSTWEEIITHYYPGASITRIPGE